MKKDGFMEQDEQEPTAREENLYDEYKAYEQAVKPKVGPFVDGIMPHIPKKEIIQSGDRKVRSGVELDNESLGDYGNRVQGFVFRSQEAVEQGDPRIIVTFVVDRSGSMLGEKMKESMKTLIFFALCLQEVAGRSGRTIDFSILFFDNGVSLAKDFADGYEEKNRRKWPDGCEATVKRRLMDESKKSGGTDMGAAIVEANSRLNKRKRLIPDYMSCLFAISDGDTFGALHGEKLTRFIQGLEAYETGCGKGGSEVNKNAGAGKSEKMGKHLKVGFYLRGGKSLSDAEKAAETPMEKYFGPRGKGTVVVDDFGELVPEARKVLRSALIRMAQRLFK